MQDLVNTPKHRDLIYDIGMHRGEDTEFYLQKGFRVVAFEADPDLVRVCRNRLTGFIDQGKLTIIEGAIVDLGTIDAGQEKVRFYKNDDRSVWGTVCTSWADRNMRRGTTSQAIEVEVTNLANVIQVYGIPHYMKIDIEGCDMACVDALGKFRERPDYLSIESAKTSLKSIKGEIDALVSLNFNCFQAVEQSAIALPIPPDPPTEGAYVDHSFQEGSSGLFGSELAGKWKTKQEILRQYRAIWLGYYFLGDEGIMNQWTFRGASRLRFLTRRLLSLLTKGAVPGWYDTHARHISADR